MVDVARHVKQMVRGLARVPGFATVAVVTLALGIGANAVIFGIVDRALLRPLPFPEPDRLVRAFDGWYTNLATVEILRERMRTVSAIGAANDATGRTFEPADGSAARRVTVAEVSPEYFEALGVVPLSGRLFRPEESRSGRGRVAVVSADFWRSALGGGTDVLARDLVLDGDRYAVVGVLPEGFDLPSRRNEIWLPITVDASDPGLYWGAGMYTVVARLAPGVTTAQALAEVMTLEEPVRLANPLWTPNPGYWEGARITSLRDARASGVRGPLTVLLGAVAVVLLVVCANVANLLLARGLSRSRDLAVRAALGAGSRRLALEQFGESAVLAAGGMGVGLALAGWGLAAVRPWLPSELPGATDVGLDLRVVLVTAGLAVLTSLVAGALPAARSARRAPAVSLRESGRAGVSRSRHRTTRGLVSAQLAAAVVLVISAGLLARSLMALNRVDPGFAVEGLVTAKVHLAPGVPPDAGARALAMDELAGTLLADPALGQVALASTIPFGGEAENMATFIVGVTDDPNELPVTRHHRVSASYFETAGIPVLRGRGLAPTDRLGTPLVAVIDQTFADRFLAGQDPIGRIVRYPWRGAPDIEIVGVVGATRDGDLSEDLVPTFWVPLAQMSIAPIGHAVVVARTAGDPAVALGSIMRRVRQLDERMAVSELMTYDELLGVSLAGTRLMAALLMVFAVSALLLGCVGVYGVAAFSVRERLREIGVRMAMGASASGIRRAVLRDGLLLALPGGIAGLLLAMPATRALEGLLFGVAPLDPLTFLAVPVLLGSSALLAVYVPARRATNVDPAIVLRGEG